MPKLNPYLIENKAQIEEVREIENQELITPEEQAKVVDKLVKNEIPSYEEFMKTYQEDEGAADSYYYEVDSYGDIRVVKCYGPGWFEWVVKTTVVVGGGFVLGPVPAMVVGGLTAGGAKIAEECCDNEEDKKVFRFVSDIGRDIAVGGAVGGLVQGVGGVLAADLGGAGSNVGRSAAIKALKATGDIAVARSEYLFAASKYGAKVVGDIDKWFSLCKDLVVAVDEADKHLEHVRDGYSYKSWCKVCNT